LLAEEHLEQRRAVVAAEGDVVATIDYIVATHLFETGERDRAAARECNRTAAAAVDGIESGHESRFRTRRDNRIRGLPRSAAGEQPKTPHALAQQPAHILVSVVYASVRQSGNHPSIARHSTPGRQGYVHCSATMLSFGPQHGVVAWIAGERPD